MSNQHLSPHAYSDPNHQYVLGESQYGLQNFTLNSQEYINEIDENENTPTTTELNQQFHSINDKDFHYIDHDVLSPFQKGSSGRMHRPSIDTIFPGQNGSAIVSNTYKSEIISVALKSFNEPTEIINPPMMITPLSRPPLFGLPLLPNSSISKSQLNHPLFNQGIKVFYCIYYNNF